MIFKKMGLIYGPNQDIWWRALYGMNPTPIHFPERNIIRIFFGVTDSEKFGRITYIDVDENNPSKIIDDPSIILLDLGADGTFDDSGVIPSSVIYENGIIMLYYVGFQRSIKVPYLLFSGLAISQNTDEVFTRASQSPIMDRSKESPFSNAAPFVLKNNTLFKMWFWEGKDWVRVNNKSYIHAVISYAESSDGISWSIKKHGCIKPETNKEFSLGRPWVLFHKGIYKMFYSVRHLDKFYRLGYAESQDGITWIRKDELLNIDISPLGWDSEMICYPSVIEVNNKIYLFYNGNNNGETGFGYAELIEE